MFLFKLAFKNILSKKIQSFMIAMVFILVSVLCILSTSIKELTMKAKNEQLRHNTMNSQISITKEGSEEYFFNFDTVNYFKNIYGIKQITPRFSETVIFENDSVFAIGTDLKKQQEIYNFDFFKKTDDVFDKLDSIILTEALSKKYNLSLNSIMKLSYKDETVGLVVRGIINDNSTNSNVVVTNILNMQKLFKKHDQVSSLRVTIDDLSRIETVQSEILVAIKNNDLSVQKQYDLSTYETYTGTIGIAINILLFFIILVSIFLCYSMFKIHIFEKNKQYGILRSIGFTKDKVLKLEYLEYFIITIPALLIGIALSFPIVSFMVLNISGYSATDGEKLINSKNLLMLGLIVLAPVITFLYDIFKSARVSVVDQIKGFVVEINKKNKFAKLSIGLLFFSVSIMLYFSNTRSKNLNTLIFSATIFLISFLLLSEYIVNLQLKILNFIFTIVFPKTKVFLQELVYQIRGLKNSIILMILVVGLGCVGLTVYTVVNGSVQEVYKNSDILLSNYISNKNDIVSKEIKSLVEKTDFTVVKRCNKKVNNDNVIISGIDINTYKNAAFEVAQEISLDEMLDKLSKENKGIIISQSFAKSHKLGVGDKIKLDTISEKAEYKIIGIISSFEGMGKVLFILEKDFDVDFVPFYTDFLISSQNKSEIESIKNKLKDNLENKISFSIITIEELLRESSQQNQVIFAMIGCIILVSTFVSVLGLVNDLIINILKQEKDFAIKRAIGFSKKRIATIIICLGLVSGITCGVSGVLFGKILNIYILEISSYYIGSLSNVQSNTPVYLILLSMFVGIVGSIYPAIKINNLNLVEKIKGGE